MNCQWQIGARLEGKCWRPGVLIQNYEGNTPAEKLTRYLCEPHWEELAAIRLRQEKERLAEKARLLGF